MPEHLQPEPQQPPAPASAPVSSSDADGEGVELLSRSPHPYRRQNFELLDPSGSLAQHQRALLPPDSSVSPTKYSTAASDSGTDADDEHTLKRLPPPRTRSHKGLRGASEPLSGASTPLPSPALLEEEGRAGPARNKRGLFSRGASTPVENSRRRKEIIRRSTELLLLLVLAGLVYQNQAARQSLLLWQKETIVQVLLNLSLLCLYPLRVVIWTYKQGRPSKTVPLAIPSSFDPAPVLYPQFIPLLVSLLVTPNVLSAIPTNLVLSLCTIPGPLIPGHSGPSDALHWLISCIPITISNRYPASPDAKLVSQEVLVLLYPLHQQLCMTLHSLTTTSLLRAELQLLSVGLVNTLVLSCSPQAVILSGVLWGGGLGIVILCGWVIKQGIALARVPRWRFRRSRPSSSRGPRFFRTFINRVLLLHRRPGIPGFDPESDSTGASDNPPSDPDWWRRHYHRSRFMPALRRRVGTIPAAEPAPRVAAEAPESHPEPPPRMASVSPPPRRHTLPSRERASPIRKTHTSSGRRRRSPSSTSRSFFELTREQAEEKKNFYASYVYLSVLGLVLGAIRPYIKSFALSGYEPVGWALGYLFGDLPWFRFQVVKANRESWVALPPRPDGESAAESCGQGWVQHLRHASFGEANTRLILSGYWLGIIVTGLAVVLQLSPICEVDTRRKVFHFMMVAMFLPTAYVDPAYVALALSLVLAVFLLLDLLRTSQLPPLSKPIAAFLAPYVDGRDLRGPVVISHIFLLVGCAIPLWLSLAALPRAGQGPLAGWEVPTRDASMVSGVICVGLGDSAASLIGRRWGRRKWVWGGGKSLEGSVAFAIAVFAGLIAANLWLGFGEWPSTSPIPSVAAATDPWSWVVGPWADTTRKTGLCASMASLTEAVLTGGNDNVVVPVVLWTCVKSMGI